MKRKIAALGLIATGISLALATPTEDCIKLCKEKLNACEASKGGGFNQVCRDEYAICLNFCK
jgi:hypothetical protein